MTFPQISARRPRWVVFDLMAVVAVCALPLAAVRPPAEPGVAGLVVLMLVLGGVLWWLSARGGQIGPLSPLALPAIIALTMLELVLSCVAFACDPKAAVLILCAQVGG